MLHIGKASSNKFCDKCGVQASFENPLIAFDVSRVEPGRRNQLFQVIYLHPSCARMAVNTFLSMLESIQAREATK